MTEREMSIAKLVCDGLSNREIGVALGITHGTVRIHLAKIYVKTGCANRTQLAMHMTFGRFAKAEI